MADIVDRKARDLLIRMPSRLCFRQAVTIEIQLFKILDS